MSTVLPEAAVLPLGAVAAVVDELLEQPAAASAATAATATVDVKFLSFKSVSSR
jgi:hypothetical protein